MVRKCVSLLLVLSLAVTLIALTAPPLQSAPENHGDADPTGLDNGRRITSERITPMSVRASENAIAHWIENYVIRLTLRSLGL